MADFTDDFESGLGAWTTSGAIATSTDEACDFTHSLKVTTDPTTPPYVRKSSGLTGLGDDNRWVYMSFGLFVPSWSNLWQSGADLSPDFCGVFTTGDVTDAYLFVEPDSPTTGTVAGRGVAGSVAVGEGVWNSIVFGFRWRAGSPNQIDAHSVINGVDAGTETFSIGTRTVDSIFLGDDETWPSPDFAPGTVYVDRFSYQADTILPDVTCSPPPDPVVTEAPSGVAGTTAVLQGEVNPEGVSSTAFFEYGLTTGYGTTTPAQAIGSGSDPVAVEQFVTGLRPGRTYHCRIVRNP